MTAALPRTIRAIDTERLLLLEEEAARAEFSQRLPVDWLREHTGAAAVHYLFPMMEHRLSHRPEVSPQWRCRLLLTVRTGEEVLSLLDVLPATFHALSETLDAAAKTDIASRMETAPAVREWIERVR
ncbi:hypothetical protein F3K40_41895 [Streptomyces sp. LBUM 1478]|uniref:Uncharacterized protein n=1 Tax=Streptomyces scabiei (strain 87.22) TaxID=680198 RepID=C9Z7V7_STRSW|nr:MULTISPECIES: hypothetical protein [Streptomyces]MBP5865988.1 hypothetical protein [Streptomyces sp. LBUM 1484]MBP5910547.1 hypothetical protein [Streptomyces sp. LBUM 1478]MBP5934098.1 hypothetical protein [Streptomyces sp. LBUM 1479]MBP5873262.1 hypothetical protein [Streptomyces sp. LBUM 1477]MBP5880946.1 hypothetical protein [Streptomyces sp. LBUM 1487]